MALQNVNPVKCLEQAVDSLEELSGFFKQAATDTARAFAVEHLINITNALAVMESLIHLISQVNAPALAEAQAAHLQYIQSEDGSIH